MNKKTIRISKNQKHALLFIHLIELKQGLHKPVNTGYLRRKVDDYLGVEMKPNNFLVAMHTLVEHGYLVCQPNTDKLLNANARDNEMMWQLTEQGRQYAEAVHFTKLRPKRRYTRRKKLNPSI